MLADHVLTPEEAVDIEPTVDLLADFEAARAEAAIGDCRSLEEILARQAAPATR